MKLATVRASLSRKHIANALADSLYGAGWVLTCLAVASAAAIGASAQQVKIYDEALKPFAYRSTMPMPVQPCQS